MLHLVGEVDVAGGVAGDGGADAGDAAKRLRDPLVAEERDRVLAWLVVAKAGQRQGERGRFAVWARREREGRVSESGRGGELLELSQRAFDRGTLSARAGDDNERRRGGAGELGTDPCREVSLIARCSPFVPGETCIRAAGSARARSSVTESKQREERTPEHALDDRRPEVRVGVVGSEVRQEGDASAVDARAEQLEQGREDGDRAGDRAGDHGDRAGRDPVEDPRADRELPGHRDRITVAPAIRTVSPGGARGALERLVRGEAAAGAPRVSG